MSDLRAMQLQLANAMLTNDMRPLVLLRGNDQADNAARLAVYQHGYRVRLREALAVEFCGLALLAGRRFPELLDQYVAARPSTHYNIRWHGEALAVFLAGTSPWSDHPALAEMARLDWAISTVFDAADHVTLTAADLAGMSADAWATLRLHPLPHVHVLACHWNIDAFRRAADRGRPRPALRRLRRTRHLLVWRPTMDVRYRHVAATEHPALDGALAGEPFAHLCQRLAERYGAAAPPRMAAILARWLEEGLISRRTLAP